MNAIQFIQQYGIEKARKVIDGAPDGATSIIGEKYFRFTDKEYWYWSFSGCKSKGKSEQYFYYNKRTTYLSEIKRLVDSVDLIKKHGGLFSTKCQLDKGGSHYDWYGENGDYGLTALDDLEQAVVVYEQLFGNTEVF